MREIRLLADWILEHLGPDVPLHFTAFHPDFKLQDKPKTPPETLHMARRIALDAGLHYVYEGNIYTDAAHTSCPSCGQIVIRRSWHDVMQNLLRDGGCPSCGLKIPGQWKIGQWSAPALSPNSGKFSSKYDDLNL